MRFSRLYIHLTYFFKIHDHVQKIVNGKELTFDDKNLQSLTNFAKICKVYKLGLQNNGKRKADNENGRWNDPVECTKIIVGSIALRGSS
jgi:Kinase binding protein CGI-121